MSKMKIYLAGKMTGLNYEEMNTWRVEATNMLKKHNIETFNPVDFYDFDTMEKLNSTELEVMDFDLNIVRNSQLVLVNLNFPNSIGTAIEMYEAYKHLKIPVITFGIIKNHGWIESCRNKHSDTMEEAINYIVSFYLPIYS